MTSSLLTGTVAGMLAVACAAEAAQASGRYFDVAFPPSTNPGELVFGVTYTIWIPDGVEPIRAVIVHQHGCGPGACQGGATAAYDLHWQALARKWNCALLGPSYQQPDKQNCRGWCDPRNGSAKAFLNALDKLAEKSRHPELKTAPWCLWGHSGGAFWASLMQTMYPERIVAIWFRSGTAYAAWEKGDIPRPEIPEAVYAIPMMCNPGSKENGDKRFHGAWTGTLAMFRAYRAKDAPIGFAPDPNTSHECGNCRYLAIPFFDACLAMRLPKKGNTGATLRPVDRKSAWLAPLFGRGAQPAAEYQGDPLAAVWLPSERVARAWEEYVATGSVRDSTPPPAPHDLRVATTDEGAIRLTWSAEADPESGIGAFLIHRDGQTLARLPETPRSRFGRPLFQGMSYGDTPEQPFRRMEFIDASRAPDRKHEYRVVSVNSVGVASPPSRPAAAF